MTTYSPRPTVYWVNWFGEGEGAAKLVDGEFHFHGEDYKSDFVDWVQRSNIREYVTSYRFDLEGQ